ncbi:hypothetical protein CC78DRAFT_536293 [Lojkania enalia]|uniref:F-box domain-containing protein n=1 Tax=Lojkania enalia TaxID=147567 RepID=A0A9P4K2D2_9PLEO|nr:hypothetical protein CC78DRAFT_536293 [Didymosphaeria enalia]
MATDNDVTATHTRSLLSLPAEIIVEIVSHVPDVGRAELLSLAQTCQFLQPLCEQHIYGTIELYSTNHLRAIIHALTRRPKRVETIHTLKILYEYHNDLDTTVEERQVFNGFIKNMKALRDWHIESPYDSCFHWTEGSEWVGRDMVAFREAIEAACLYQGQVLHEDVGLAKLEKFVLHSHGPDSDFWELGDYHCLFRHPTLRILHLSCVHITSAIPELSNYTSTTPLLSLAFEECEISPAALSSILRTPKSLRRLMLGENESNIRLRRGPKPLLSQAPDESLQALSYVAHSLETLYHIDPMWRTVQDHENPAPLQFKGDGMRNFERLEFIVCDANSFLHRGITGSPMLAPPHLSALRLQKPILQPHHWINSLPRIEPYFSLSSLKKIDFVQPLRLRDVRHMAMVDYICKPDFVRDRHAAAYKLWKHGINMTFTVEMHSKHTIIPPYLHGEPTPKLLRLYDAKQVGFHRHIADYSDEPDQSGEPVDPSILLQKDENGTSPSPIETDAKSMTLVADEEEKEPPETDQLGMQDVNRLNNEVRRTLERYHEELEKERSSGTGAHINIFATSEDEEIYDDDFMDDDPFIDDMELFVADNEEFDDFEDTSEGLDGDEGWFDDEDEFVALIGGL